jgi:hypothetical protein
MSPCLFTENKMNHPLMASIKEIEFLQSRIVEKNVRIEALEKALRKIADRMPNDFTLAQEMAQIARAALAPEQDK